MAGKNQAEIFRPPAKNRPLKKSAPGNLPNRQTTADGAFPEFFRHFLVNQISRRYGKKQKRQRCHHSRGRQKASNDFKNPLFVHRKPNNSRQRQPAQKRYFGRARAGIENVFYYSRLRQNKTARNNPRPQLRSLDKQTKRQRGKNNSRNRRSPAGTGIFPGPKKIKRDKNIKQKIGSQKRIVAQKSAAAGGGGLVKKRPQTDRQRHRGGCEKNIAPIARLQHQGRRNHKSGQMAKHQHPAHSFKGGPETRGKIRPQNRRQKQNSQISKHGGHHRIFEIRAIMSPVPCQNQPRKKGQLGTRHKPQSL